MNTEKIDCVVWNCRTEAGEFVEATEAFLTREGVSNRSDAVKPKSALLRRVIVDELHVLGAREDEMDLSDKVSACPFQEFLALAIEEGFKLQLALEQSHTGSLGSCP
jgi:hypothetical protein